MCTRVGNGCKIEKNYNKIFNDKNVDIIFISSSTNTHIKFIEEGMKRKKTILPLELIDEWMDDASGGSWNIRQCLSLALNSVSGRKS